MHEGTTRAKSRGQCRLIKLLPYDDIPFSQLQCSLTPCQILCKSMKSSRQRLTHFSLRRREQFGRVWSGGALRLLRAFNQDFLGAWHTTVFRTRKLNGFRPTPEMGGPPGSLGNTYFNLAIRCSWAALGEDTVTAWSCVARVWSGFEEINPSTPNTVIQSVLKNYQVHGY